MSMYNLLEYTDSYFMESGRLWNYYRGEGSNFANENNDANNHMITNSIVTGSTPNNNSRLNEALVIPLKYLNNFRKSLDMHLINCDIELDLTWSKYCVVSKISGTPVWVEPIHQMQH